KESNAFALNILGKGQQAMAFTFFKPAERQGSTISGEAFHAGSTGSPVLDKTPAFVECRLVASVEKGDHSVFVGEVVDAGVGKEPEGRADDATLWLKELGDKVFYGGDGAPAPPPGPARHPAAPGRGGGARRRPVARAAGPPPPAVHAAGRP